MLGNAVGVGQGRQDKDAAGAEVLVGIRLGHGVVHGEVIGNLQSGTRRNLDDSVAIIAIGGEAAGGQSGVEFSVAVVVIQVGAVGSPAIGAVPVRPFRVGIARLGVEHANLGKGAGAVAHEPAR